MADIFQTIFTFLNEHMWNSIQIPWKCISRVAIKNIPELVQIMAAPLSLNGLIIFTISRPVKQPWGIYDEINVIHYSDVIMSTIACLITSLAVVYSTVYSDADQRKHQSSASLAFVRGIHRDPPCISKTHALGGERTLPAGTHSLCGEQRTLPELNTRHVGQND